MRKTLVALWLAMLGMSLLGPTGARAAAAVHGSPMFGSGPVVSARASEPVVINGSQIPSWSRAAAQGQPAPYPSGVSTQYSSNGVGGDGVRSAHNGYTVVPPDVRTGVNPDQIAAYRWDGANWSEIPVQVDQMSPFYLANAHSSFSFYSGTSYELTYDWAPTAHTNGEESWKQVFGGTAGDPADTSCNAKYQDPGAAGQAELTAAETLQPGASNPAVNQPVDPLIPPDDYTKATPDPVNPLTGPAQLADSDQVAMMAGDAGLMAPSGTAQPAGTFANNGQQITVADPTAAADGSAAASYIYLFLQPGGSSYNSSNGYVQMTPNSDAYQWIDVDSFAKSDPEILGTSNQSYGANLPGMVCVTAPNNTDGLLTQNGVPRFSKDRQPRDDFTITTPTYQVDTTGRWMVRQLHISAPGTTYNYGPNLISRWKGRAFQSSPDSTVSVVGFEDEQTNWEINASLLGWKVGPVRAIREVWGADSGTNVTKTEIYYRDAYDFQYHLRVHPIPTDGLYTSWDMRYGVVNTYYNTKNEQGVPIDGTNSHSVGEVDKLPVTGQPAYANTCDPTYDICSAIDNPEEISGPNGSMVFVGDIPPNGATSFTQPALVPFYEDNACFDDGTGDAPVPRPFPGDDSTSATVEKGYVDYWKAHGAAATITYSDLKCAPPTAGQPGYQQAGFDSPTTMPFQGAIGEIGVHYFFTNDSDHRVDEVDADEWVYTVPTAAPANLISVTASTTGNDYGNDVVAPLQTVVTPFNAPATNVSEAPVVALLPLLGIAALAIRGRRRLASRRA